MSISIHLLIISLLGITCNNTHKKNPEIKDVIPFEIVFGIHTSKYCQWTKYTLTNKSLTIEIGERVKPFTDPSGKQKTDCMPKIIHQQNIISSNELAQISTIVLDKWQASSNKECVGGITHNILFRKEGEKKEITYYGCAVEFDKNTKTIVKYINSQLPSKYQIDL